MVPNAEALAASSREFTIPPQGSKVRFKGDEGGVLRTSFYLVFERKILVTFWGGGWALSFQMKGF